MTEMEEFSNALKSGRATDKKMLVKPNKDYAFEMNGRDINDVPLKKLTPTDSKMKTGVEGFDNIPINKMKSMKKGGSVSSASKRADGCCVKGKTKGRML
jgi:hypothetical protein